MQKSPQELEAEALLFQCMMQCMIKPYCTISPSAADSILSCEADNEGRKLKDRDLMQLGLMAFLPVAAR